MTAPRSIDFEIAQTRSADWAINRGMPRSASPDRRTGSGTVTQETGRSP